MNTGKISIRKTLLIGIFLVAAYFFFGFLKFFIYVHKLEPYNFKRYTWFFKEPLNIDTFNFFGGTRKSDTYYMYIYNHSYYISIWEFNDLKDLKLEDAKINLNIELSQINFKPNEILNSECWPTINTHLGFRFKNAMEVNIDKYSSISQVLNQNITKDFMAL